MYYIALMASRITLCWPVSIDDVNKVYTYSYFIMVYNVVHGYEVRYCLVIETLYLKGQTAPRTEITMDKVMLDESLLHHKKIIRHAVVKPPSLLRVPALFCLSAGRSLKYIIIYWEKEA